MLQHEQIEEIHQSLINGQKRQMVNQIEDYGLYDFWDDYSSFLVDFYIEPQSRYHYFTDAVISYHRIVNR